MKKILLGVVLCVGCSKGMLQEEASVSSLQQQTVNNSLTTVSKQEKYRTYDEVLKIAQNSLAMLNKNRTEYRDIDYNNGVKTYVKNGSRESKDTVLYVFNFKDKKGFAIVSANKATDGFIAVTESGHYDPNLKTSNLGFEAYMDMVKSCVSEAELLNVTKEYLRSTNSINEYRRYEIYYDTLYDAKVTPKINVRWGQGGCAGQYCPNNIAGCSNTAVAQIMTYFQYPNTLSLSYPERDVSTMTIDWNSLSSYTYTWTSGTSNTQKTIGRLLRELGHRSNSSYETNSTSTYFSDSRNTVSGLGYIVGNIQNYPNHTPNDANLTSDDYAFINNLINGKLICMCGNQDGSTGGHQWVIDGCNYNTTLEYLRYTTDEIHWIVVGNPITHVHRENHINWGWDGISNGYFNFQIFNPQVYVSLDPNCSAVNTYHNYISNLRFFTVYH